MLDRFLNWIRDYVDDRREYKILLRRCNSCEYLKTLLEQEREEKLKLLDSLIKIANPKPEMESMIQEESQPIRTSSYVPFRVKRQQLEMKSLEEKRRQDVERSMKMNESKSTEELESELLGG